MANRIQISPNVYFNWYINPEYKNKEIYGWNETENGVIIKGSGGYFRTINPEVAAKIAKSNLSLI